MLSAQRLDDVDAWLAQQQSAIQARGLAASVCSRLGDPASEILAAVKDEQADLIAMTTHGATGLERWLLGSVAENVLRHCDVPLLVLRTRRAP